MRRSRLIWKYRLWTGCGHCLSIHHWRPLETTAGAGAFAMVELLIGLLILSFAIIPIYHIFSSSRRSVFRSEVSYLALQAARERLEELKLYSVPELIRLSQAGTTQWEPVTGNAMTRLLKATENNPDPAAVAGSSSSGSSSSGGSAVTPLENNRADFPDSEYSYPVSYSRIFTRLRISRIKKHSNPELDTPPWLFRATVFVRWFEMGNPGQSAADDPRQAYSRGMDKRFTSRLDTIISAGGFGEVDPR